MADDFMSKKTKFKIAGLPKAQGLYNPVNEHDACGVGLVLDIKNRPSFDIVEKGLAMLCNLEHRGAVGADPKAGDGSGLLIQIPHKFLEKKVAESFSIPKPGDYGVGVIFIPNNTDDEKKIKSLIEKVCLKEQINILGWRLCPTYTKELGWSVLPSTPVVYQLFLEKPESEMSQDDFEKKLFIIRRCIEKEVLEISDQIHEGFYIPSFSSRTILYKGMVLADQVGGLGEKLGFYEDLTDSDIESSFALIHQRFSTNTFPTWSLAQPFRMLCHNGEINTVRGNINWMNARHKNLASPSFSENDLNKIWPVIEEGQSDSASFDNALELLVRGGYSISEAMLIMIPEAWQNNDIMDKNLKSFYEYHAPIMEPWDGPANIAFTDGKQIGALLDRNGLRPARYLITEDDKVIFASEMGLIPVDESKVKSKWRLEPGKMLLIDLEKGAMINDQEIKNNVANKRPWEKLLKLNQLNIDDIPNSDENFESDYSLKELQKAFGYTQEDEKFLINPMIASGMEATGSMGTDTPIAPLSLKSKPMFTYFKQKFAQVTNPPIDPIREEMVMALNNYIGPRPNVLRLDQKEVSKFIKIDTPILDENNANKIKNLSNNNNSFISSEVIDITFNAEDEKIENVLKAICEKAEKAINNGKTIIILSDKFITEKKIPIPSLLATSKVHQYLIEKGLRTSAGLIIETGEAREVHHFCCLAGYGADAIHPWLAMKVVENLAVNSDQKKATENFIKALGKGIKKVMSKMGICTYQSYCGAQIFDAIGLSTEFIDEFFTGTSSLVEGLGIEEIEKETISRHNDAFSKVSGLENLLDVGGEYAVRLRGEKHSWESDTVRDLQHAVRSNSSDTYKKYADSLNIQNEKLMTLRGLFKIKKAEDFSKKPIAIEEVEEAKEIVKRFATGAMSFGSISREAHTNLAIAMNRIGGRSNTGEGGEEADRFLTMENGDSMRSSIKQVASGRFGVTAEYLANSDMIQIKMAQGAKPGEGGQLPGHKVDKTIASVRFSTPGVGLISPPPHHDIYSIEDLAQLIYDLKNTNPSADISVKLVSEVGVGTVAAGVSKAKADHVTISGFEGGTGASPLTSIKHAGSPWELGLAETHQTLVINGLRSRITVQADGGLKTGRDVVVAALLGADEFGFSTAPLIASGCIMMRKCHLNTCPVGIATQDPELRKLFNGQPEHVINFFFFVAEEARSYMSKMGFKTFDEMIGQTQFLDTDEAVKHWKTQGMDFEKLFYKPDPWDGDTIYRSEEQNHDIYEILDRKLIKESAKAINELKPVQISSEIKNTDRSTGAMLSGEIAKIHGHKGLAEDTINIKLKGTAGQSFGVFLAKGISLDLEGEANDYVGKGISGGRIAIYPPKNSNITPEENIIVGNTVLYGGITGECYFNGIAGERFAVRNSGATAVVEGAGDHCCEYMTGGIIVVLGKVGRNFGAGMSGGIAYVLDEDNNFKDLYNSEMIELEKISNSDEKVFTDNLLIHDKERLKNLIENHHRYTNSQKAKRILDNFENYLPKFIKVMPTEYKRVLMDMYSSKETSKDSVKG
ncbi:MAG: glutamate synthase large subunit [Pseudomonadota bacterium]|nr:glutamate synthase large subunit [Pseudomonadota bacterium]